MHLTTTTTTPITSNGRHRRHRHHLLHSLFLPYSSSNSFSPLSFPTKSRCFKILSCFDQPLKPTSGDHLRVVMAAGGTGGHITPALAIADELRNSDPDAQFLFIGAPDSMESSTVPSAGYPFASIPTAKLFRPLPSLKNLALPINLIKSLILSYKLIKKFEPHIVIGTGGYVSFATCLAAVLKGTKLAIQEQNSVPGIANYVLSLFADVVFVSFNSTLECFPVKHKCVVCGNPVRLSLRKFVSKEVARSKLLPLFHGGEGERKVILVLGGSLGANAINIALLNLYSQLLSKHGNWCIIWQTGVESYNEMESLVRNQSRLVLTPFMQSMDLAYAAADLIVSRAGAMTCSEILATGKPAILIPAPNAAEGHQFKNASLMADIAGSRAITEDELDSITLGTTIEEILGDENLMAEMSERARKAARPEASAEIARRILSIVESTAKQQQ